MFNFDTNYTMEEFIRMAMPGFPRPAGNLWEMLMIMAKEMDAQELEIRKLQMHV